MASLAVKHAWKRYLTDTKDLTGPCYVEVEDWAWHRLVAAIGTPPTRKAAKKRVTANAT